MKNCILKLVKFILVLSVNCEGGLSFVFDFETTSNMYSVPGFKSSNGTFIVLPLLGIVLFERITSGSFTDEICISNSSTIPAGGVNVTVIDFKAGSVE